MKKPPGRAAFLYQSFYAFGQSDDRVIVGRFKTFAAQRHPATGEIRIDKDQLHAAPIGCRVTGHRINDRHVTIVVVVIADPDAVIAAAPGILPSKVLNEYPALPVREHSHAVLQICLVNNLFALNGPCFISAG